jgi:hypothetical protein
VSAADTWTIIGGTTAFVGLLIGVQGYWIGRVLDLLRSDLVELRQRLDRIDGRLEGIEHGYGERIARLEAAAGGGFPGRPRSAG